MSRELSRIQNLVHRVGWLDRYRRTIAVALALVCSALLLRQFDGALGAALVTAVIGLFLWCVIEVGLVWLTALWETECAELIRDRGMPRARVHKAG